jgi:hypothetical protein
MKICSYELEGCRDCHWRRHRYKRKKWEPTETWQECWYWEIELMPGDTYRIEIPPLKRKIPDQYEIPEWCPLPDVEEEGRNIMVVERGRKWGE